MRLTKQMTSAHNKHNSKVINTQHTPHTHTHTHTHSEKNKKKKVASNKKHKKKKTLFARSCVICGKMKIVFSDGIKSYMYVVLFKQNTKKTLTLSSPHRQQ